MAFDPGQRAIPTSRLKLVAAPSTGLRAWSGLGARHAALDPDRGTVASTRCSPSQDRVAALLEQLPSCSADRATWADGALDLNWLIVTPKPTLTRAVTTTDAGELAGRSLPRRGLCGVARGPGEDRPQAGVHVGRDRWGIGQRGAHRLTVGRALRDPVPPGTAGWGDPECSCADRQRLGHRQQRYLAGVLLG